MTDDTPFGQNRTGNVDSAPLTGKRERAAMLIAEDELTDAEIAAEVGIARSTLALWRKQSEFAARVQRIRVDLQAAILAEGIAHKQNRIAKLVDRHKLMERVIAERAVHGGAKNAGKAPTDGGFVPGVETGLLVMRYRMVGTGEDATLVEDWGVDTSLLTEMRQTEKQVAQEAGQWTERASIASDVVYRIVGVDAEAV